MWGDAINGGKGSLRQFFCKTGGIVVIDPANAVCTARAFYVIPLNLNSVFVVC